MINTITAHVIGANRYEFEGRKGGKLGIIEKVDPDNDNQIGFQYATLTAPYELLDQMHAIAPHLPCNLEIDAEIRSSQGKMTMHAIAVRLPSQQRQPGQNANAKPDTKTDAKSAS